MGAGPPGSLASGPGKIENDGAGPQTPLEILKIRFARGEITREEFERMKKDLE